MKTSNGDCAFHSNRCYHCGHPVGKKDEVRINVRYAPTSHLYFRTPAHVLCVGLADQTKYSIYTLMDDPNSMV
jgi:hypothetical protein